MPKLSITKFVSALLAICLLLSATAHAQRPARHAAPPSPPMGWNSWDSYGTTVNEEQVRSAAKWIAAHLKSYGWQYVVVDMEWFVINPTPGGNSRNSQFELDYNGRYVPAENRFPSSSTGAGFKPLADYVHSLGLKFGIHILRGIPKDAVAENLPIADSTFRAADTADTTDICPWNPDNYGVKSGSPAAQAYYDSIARLYASWGVDFVKVDCIASHPYKPDDIRMLAEALRKTGRPIALSLSPGPAPIDKVDELRRYAEMWRTSNDVWDLWHSNTDYPQGVSDQFARLAQWAPLVEPGHWPDADMIPIGYLGPAPGLGRARTSRLSHDEQRTLLTLWSIFRSPLMWGGNPGQSDDWTTSLLTNREVLDVDQHSRSSRAVIQTDTLVAWASEPMTAEPESGDGTYVAVFNLQSTPQSVRLPWNKLGLRDEAYRIRDLWEHKNLPASRELTVDLPPHGSVLYKISR